jgi:biopolymer transport protein TolQ
MNQLILPGIFSGSIWQIIANSSVFGLFILFVLAVMSFISWIVIFHKWRQFRSVEQENSQFLHSFKRSKRLADSVGQAKNYATAPASQIFVQGLQELGSLSEARNEGGALQESRRPLEADDFEIVEMTMERSLTEQTSILEQRVVFLATTANAAPFLGLLGTVVGIMDSFWAIGQQGSASLSVVAPGLAEALLATIVGLGAAIPAVIAYNWANSRLKALNDDAFVFILEFLARAKKEAI